MFGFGKVFKKAQQVTNTNLMEAIVAGLMWIAASNGEIGKAEREKIDKLLTSNPQLKAFKPAEIRKVMQRYESMLDADFEVGRHSLMKELMDISDNSDHCEQVFLNMLAVAKADNDIDESEKTELLKVARFLGINNVAEYGLA